jgi:hypothetical protein
MLTPKRLIDGSVLSLTGTVYYTVPTSTTTIVKELVLCNTDAITNTVDIWFVAAGTANTAVNQIFQDLALVAGETKIFSLSSVIGATGTIKASASKADVVHISASGIEVT